MAEIWPSRLRASGMGLAYGAGNLGKFIGPAWLAVIAGSSNFVSPAATAEAMIPAMNYFAGWLYPGADSRPLHRLRDTRPHDRRAR
jgi:MFS transporter, putative metabolite:H+ symporter